MKKIVVIGFLLAFFLSGCAEILAAQRREDSQKCLAEGFRPGTDSFKLCLLTIEETRKK